MWASSSNIIVNVMMDMIIFQYGDHSDDDGDDYHFYNDDYDYDEEEEEEQEKQE